MKVQRFVVGLVLALVAALVPLTMSAPAGAVSTGPTVTYHDTTPRWVGEEAAIHVGGTASVSTDWSWWNGGWTVRFNWSETRQMARGFSYCTVIATLAAPWAVGAALAAACGVMWIVADWAVGQGRCIKAFVPVSLLNPSISTWGCSH